MRHPQVDPRTPPVGQPLRDGLGVLRQRRHEHLPRHLLRGLVAARVPPGGHAAVELLQELLDDRAGGQLLDLVDDEAALTTDAATPDVEDLHRSLERVLGDSDDVCVGAVRQHHRLLFHRPLERADVVPEPGGPLVLLSSRGRGHLTFQPADVRGRRAGHEVAEVLDDLAVLLGADPPDAGGRALVDVAEQAGATDLAGPLEDAGRAGARRKDPEQQIERLADRPRVGVRPEVAHPAAARPRMT